MTMMHKPAPLFIADYPFLMSAVMHAALTSGCDPAVRLRKAQRILNKVSYSPRELDKQSGKCWETRINEVLDRELLSGFMVGLLHIERDSSTFIGRVIEQLDQKDAGFGKLHDFISHVLSEDE